MTQSVGRRPGTIGAFVRERTLAGEQPENIWRAAQVEFYPLRKVGWSYVLKIYNETRRLYPDAA